MALDIAEGKNINHAKKVAYTSIRVARTLGLDDKEVKKIYYAAIMHDIGASDNRISIYNGKLKRRVHCKEGEDIVKKLKLPQEVHTTIRYHHENWDGTGPFELSRDEIPLSSQIVYLADQFDSIFNNKINYAKAREELTNVIIQKKKKQLSPEVVDGFIKMSEEERFWLDYKFDNFDEILNRVLPKETVKINLETLENVSEVFAQIIDNKSEFTHNHSRGIANKIKETISFLNYDEITQRKAYIAGLLHDLGKIAVPNSILNKPGKLNEKERYIINIHPYYTKLILDQIPGIEDITSWAANHHERIDGKGYPERLSGQHLGKIERLMCVCDVYQALTEDRPYRSGMKDSKAWEIIDSMVKDGALCHLASRGVRVALK
nr:HD domain-containing phosphohydrolase [Clostridium ganghwense]